MVTNDKADQGGDDENDVTPAAAGKSAEAEGEHHDGAFDFGPPRGAGPVRPPPVAEETPRCWVSPVDMIQMPELK